MLRGKHVGWWLGPIAWAIPASSVCLLVGCGSSGTGGAGLPAARLSSETKCNAARGDAPIVTEWSASERANLESRSSGGAIAVRYAGCDLAIVERCRLPGKYAYRRTTLATDTFEIRDAADLYAKVPVGAFRLEADLARSGRLAMRTTVVGQYHLFEEDISAAGRDPACAEATHVVGSIAVGAFSLLGGDTQSVGGGAATPWAGAGAKTRSEESVVRQVGDARACASSDATAPATAPPQACAAPLQLFLVPLAHAGTRADRDQASVERRAREQGVLMDIPKHEDGERWQLHDAEGRVLCDAPCSRWIAPRSGYYLERVASNRGDGVRIDVPNEWQHAPGAHVRVAYGPEKGFPFLSKLTFYGVGIPTATLSLGLGIAFVATDSDSRLHWFFGGTSLFYGAGAAASTWFWLYSDEKHFRTKEIAPKTTVRPSVFPLGLQGSF